MPKIDMYQFIMNNIDALEELDGVIVNDQVSIDPIHFDFSNPDVTVDIDDDDEERPMDADGDPSVKFMLEVNYLTLVCNVKLTELSSNSAYLRRIKNADERKGLIEFLEKSIPKTERIIVDRQNNLKEVQDDLDQEKKSLLSTKDTLRDIKGAWGIP